MIDSDATHNFITEAEARRLRWEKDSGRMKVVNSVALPIVGLAKRTVIKFGGWKGYVDFVVVKMDDFDIVLGMEFLLEHQVIPMPSTKCLVVTESFPTIVQADIRQFNGFKMISAMQLDKSPTQEEPPSAAIPLGTLGKLGEIVPEDTLCVPEKYHEAKAPAKNAYRTMPPELAELRKQSKKLLGTRFSRHVQAPWGVPILSLKKKERSLRWCIDRRSQNTLTTRRKYPLFIEVGKRKIAATCDERIPKSVVELRSCLELTNSNGQSMNEFLKRASSLTELYEEEDIQWGGNLECQAAFDYLKQATIDGPSLRVVGATEPFKVEAEQFNYMFEKYLHHFVDGRQGNWAQLLNVAQFEDDPQVHRVEEEWEQMADIARVCLEEASRPMEERVDQKRCSLKFE
ncbi:uncharacterized protein E5676_scaffold1738G00810 [Cucumis melo var. makuwa]|uniref:Asp_protease_2 domain-containing protein n=1 Tax=Cucumis melo var. makuwa TaxID=1194695 RepID=A0A5D3BTL4_CUCMM|nr:uncharacterized protein E5676_scaffold1738G00810 [Cucumis melo var. makuwa]